MTERFLEYAFDGLLEEHTKLIVDREMGIITQMHTGDTATITEQQIFTAQEFGAIAVLLASYPHYAPLEELMSAITGRSIERCRKDINRAFDEGEGNAVVRPIRNVISRCRVKLHAFGIDARSLLESGYLLMSDRTSRYSKHNGRSS